MDIEALATLRPTYIDDVVLDGLVIDDAYQRPMARAMYRDMTDSWNWALVGVLYINRRDDGRWYVIDGQTRRAAAMALDIHTLPSLAFEGLSMQDEAYLYVLYQDRRRATNAFDRFRAELAHESRRAVEINEAMTAHGLVLRRHGGRTAPPNSVSAVVALEYVWQRGTIHETLNVLCRAWPLIAGRFDGNILRALGAFIAVRDPDIDRLVRILKRIKNGPDGLLSRARAYDLAHGNNRGTGGNSPKFVIQVIRMDYDETPIKAAA